MANTTAPPTNTVMKAFMDSSRKKKSTGVLHEHHPLKKRYMLLRENVFPDRLLCCSPLCPELL